MLVSYSRLSTPSVTDCEYGVHLANAYVMDHITPGPWSSAPCVPEYLIEVTVAL